MSKILAIAGAFFAGWLALSAFVSGVPHNNWGFLGLSLVCFMASFFIPLP